MDPNWRLFSFYERYSKPGESLSMIEGNWKLIREGQPILEQVDPAQDATISLYDLAKDVSESTNLAAQHQEHVQRMLSELAKFRKLRSNFGVPPMVEPEPKGWKPPKNWELAPPKNEKEGRD